ncbi:universal stress protein [Bacillus carboniphilus]|uniref:Universal stress protein n=1 Tax=Bacillus carboniphilus TaxID=86663 RepID=A0ABP3FSS5_9BACI
MFKRILLASDGSEHALRAAEKTTYLTTQTYDVEVVILYVVDSSKSKSDVLSIGEGEAVKEERRRRISSTEGILQKKGINYSTQIMKGEPGPSIVEFAKKNGIDLIIIGSRGLNSFQEMVLGSVSHKVAKRAACPVMIVK